MKRRLKILFTLLVLGFLSLPLDEALACAGDGSDAGTVCTTGVGLPGTCMTDGSCHQNPNPDGTCTSDQFYDPVYPLPGQGIISTIITNIRNTLSPLMSLMFNGIAGDFGFRYAVSAAITLYVTIYAVMFMFGMVQLTVYDFFLRVVKLGIVCMLLTNGTAWGYFSTTFIHFFNDGTDSIIGQVSAIAVGGANPVPLGGSPFDIMDQTLVEAVSTRMLITLMAASTTGPYGAIIGLILTISLWSFLKSILNAMWVYIMSMVMRTLLFGLAPLFLACIMFSRTRQLFDGWLNQVVNSCLQPIFLFTFFSFFVLLIRSSLLQVMSLQVCWTEWAETLRGSPFSEHYWRFAVLDCDLGIMVPFDGKWDFNGPVGTGCGGNPIHPIGIMIPLTMWILADLAGRFNHTVVQIAKDIANATTDFRSQGGTISGSAGAPSGAPKSGAPKTSPASPTPPRSGPPSLKPGGKNQQGQTSAEVKRKFEEFGKLGNKPRGTPGG